MQNIVPGHLVSFDYLEEWLNYEDHTWYGGAMSLISNDVYKDIPSYKECDRICKEKSGRVITCQTR